MTNVICEYVSTDLLSVSITPNTLSIGKRTTATFNATVNGISTSENNFIYRWMKRGINSLPNKASGINGTVLTIPNVDESDEGRYYCTVTNEWGRSVESNNVTLFTFGKYVGVFILNT